MIELPSATESRCIHAIITQESRRHEHRLAVQDAHGGLSYGALDALSDTMAARLRAAGVCAETLVGVCLEPSVDLIIALLGVLKAGGAYVPLDPDQPSARLSQIARNAKLRYIVTSRRLLRQAPQAAHRLTVSAGPARHAVLRAAAARIGGEPSPWPPADDRQLAYVIHTSGSTGEPKGVLVEHRHLAYSTLARFDVYAAAPVDSFLLVPSFGSDSSIAVIYWTLCAGGRLVLTSAAERRDPAAIARLIRREQISHLLASPFVYGALLDIARDEDLHSLRTAIVAGEKCPGWIVRRHLSTVPRAALFNEYGPTEGAVWCSVHRCTNDDAVTVPIGKALPGTVLSIIGADERSSPLETEGELHLSGPGVVRGYLDQPAMTAQRFTPDPFGRLPGARIYATGDLTRLRADGVIDFVGRADRQLKIGANRVEPGEIENVLQRHPAIGHAHVTAEERADGDLGLLAYCVPAGTEPDYGALTAWLAERLPAWMVPRCFVFLAAFPLTANGKIDAARLPAASAASPVNEQPAAASSAIELRLIAVWEELLGVRGVQPADSFIDLGGDSMRAIRLQTEVHRVFKARLPLSTILKFDRLCDLARHLSARQASRRARRSTDRVGAHALQTPSTESSIPTPRVPDRAFHAGGRSR